MAPSEGHVRAVAQRMVDLGLVKLGYTYLNLDDGIVEVERDANGDLIPDRKGFPNGFSALAADLGALGLKFGVYTDRGTQTCGGRAGAFGHEAQDAAFYARNGILYLKEDSCNASQDHQTAFAEYAAMRDGLNATGVPIFFSLCSWEAWYAPVGHALGNSWRTGPDDINWHGVLGNVSVPHSPLQHRRGHFRQ
jgi:alpha-galactosidase